jgi:SAM-dependent methyltransferase
MRHVPIFDAHQVTLNGGASYREELFMLFERAVKLAAPGDALTARARGRQLGILFFRHDWSGVVEVLVAGQRHQIDLYAPEPTNWVFETPLQADEGVTITVRVLAGCHPSSHGNECWIQSLYVADHATHEIPDLIRQHVEENPLTAVALNQLTDTFKWFDPDWLAAMRALNCSWAYSPPDFVHRKAWEWTQCIFGLDWLGAFRPTNRALGVGVGWEPLSYFFSNYLEEVVATDLYPTEGQWATDDAREGNPKILDDPDQFAPFAYRKERLKFLRMDGKVLAFPDASFDVVWSCSSIEHFGKHAGAAQSMREIERVLKPGGVVAMITEYVLPDPVTGAHDRFHPEYFNLRCLYESLLAPVPGLRLVQHLDLSLPEYYVRRACKLPEEAGAPHSGSSKPHVVLRSQGNALHTSIAMFFRKTGSAPPSPGVRRFTASSPND